MCLGAIYWARPARVYFANSAADAAQAGFDDAFIYEEIARAARGTENSNDSIDARRSACGVSRVAGEVRQNPLLRPADLETRVIGKSVPRKEGREKVTGRARYVDDLMFPGMLHGATVRSPAARGRIRGIHFEGDIPWDEFTVVTAKDIPGKNCIALLIDDQPCLADGIRESSGRGGGAAGASTINICWKKRAARCGSKSSRCPPFLRSRIRWLRKEIIWGQDNIFKSFLRGKGRRG